MFIKSTELQNNNGTAVNVFSLSYLVMPFMGTDLGKLMKMERLSEDRVQFLVYQILRGLKVRHRYTHSVLLYSFVVSINLSVLLFFHSTFIQPGSFTGYVTSESLIRCIEGVG